MNNTLAREPSVQPIDLRRSPFFSVPFLNRLQKMIPTERGPPTRAEQEIEGALRKIPDEPHHIRKLWATDQVAFCDHLLRLDLDRRHDRFAMGVSDDFIRNYAELCFTMRGSIFQALEAGIAERTLKRAKASLGVQSGRSVEPGASAHWTWELLPEGTYT